MAVKKKGLGRGLDALFPEKPAEKKPVPKPITKEVNPKQEAESVKTTVPASDKKRNDCRCADRSKENRNACENLESRAEQNSAKKTVR